MGLNKEKIVKEVERYTGKKSDFATGSKQNSKEKTTKPKVKAYTSMQGQSAIDFFNDISNKPIQPVLQEDEDNNEGEVKYDMIPRNFNWDHGKEKIIKQSILIGNY